MFAPSGLDAKPDFLWERALLAIGDYLLENGGATWSILDNNRDGKVSWKRLLRDRHNGRRALIRALWDRMAHESLEQIATSLPDDPWRQALCKAPIAWAYCGQRFLRFEMRPGEGDNSTSHRPVFFYPAANVVAPLMWSFHLLPSEKEGAPSRQTSRNSSR